LDSTNYPLKLQSTNVSDQQQQQQLHHYTHLPKLIYYKEIEQHRQSQDNESWEKRLDQNLSQNIEGTEGDDRYAETSKEHDEDSSRDQHNDYKDRRHNSKDQH